MLDLYFTQGIAPDPLLWLQHDPWLVLLSVLVSMGASAAALHLAALARAARGPGERQMALISGALALGSGVWTMHYIGMLAFAVCGQARLDPATTLVSVLPSLVASWVALRLLVRERVRARLLWGSGLLVGAGVGAMHYIGMSASELAPLMRYDLVGFALSIVVAVLLSVLALWVRFGLRQRLRAGTVTWLGGAIMGAAIAGMHYTGMAALRFIEPIASLGRNTYTVPVQTSLSLAIAVVTVALTLMALAVNASLRARLLLRQVQQSESRLRAMADTAVDGIITIDAKGTVQSYNRAAEQLLGWRAAEVVGRNVNMLMPEPHRSAHDGYLQHHLRTGHRSIIGTGREVQAQHKNGTLVPVRLSVGRVEQPGAPLFVGFLVDLTPLKALQSERERDQEQLRSLVGNLPGVAFRSSYQVPWPMVFISEAVAQMTGWSADDFLQQRVSFGELVHTQDLDRIAQDIEHALAQQQPYAIEYRLHTRDGHTRWLSEYGRGVVDETGSVRWLDGVILDTTEAKARNAEFMGTVQAINRSQAAAEFNLQGQVLSANAHYLQLLGYTQEELVGAPYSLLCAPEFAHSAQYEAFWQRMAQGVYQAGEYLHLGKGGRALWLHATYNPILDAEGQTLKVIQFATDLSAHRAMEQELRAAKERAETAAAARASFLANMSHEIRTPMNAIIGFTEALLESPLDEVQRRHLGTVQHAARSMLRLLNDILDTAKLEKGAVELEVEPFDLRELCQQILATLRINAQKKGLALELEMAPGLPEYWLGDALRIQQILLNLAGNAIKFTHQGRVLLRASGRDGALELAVQDTGIGMETHALARIFAPFAQADASTTRRYGGTGLGTTIARQLAELMQGRIDVYSRPGEGSCFTVHLPLRAALSTPLQARHTAVQQPLAALRILGVDDVPANLELLELVLQRSGHQVALAGSGAQALERLAQERFDLVLMDLQMPDMDGLEATRRLRAWEQQQGQPRTPVLALSASVLEQDRRDALAAGMDGFAAKPLEPARLQQEMARVLGLLAEDSTAPPAPGMLALQTPEGAALPAIDWERGLRLWPQMAALRQAIEGFVHDADATLAALRSAAEAGDTRALAAGAHRLHGAAANLALQQLQASARALEHAAQSAPATPEAAAAAHPAPAWPQLLTALQTALDQVRAALPAAAGAHPQVGARPPAAALAPAAQAQVHRACSALALALAAGELPQAPLELLEQHLDAERLAPLRAALERFDFDAAQQCLRALQNAETERRAPP